MSTVSDYVLGDNDYESMFEKRGGNHFSYLNSCQVLDGVSSVDELEERMENQLIASVDYQHAGVKYSAQYVPLSVNNCTLLRRCRWTALAQRSVWLARVQ